jgi:hypothetical protein
MFRIANRGLILAALVTVGIAIAGCGSDKAELPKEEEVANQKVEALKSLADAMAKEADGPNARGELENFRNVMIDVKKSSKQVEEMNEIYRQRIQGKYKGFVAQEVQSEMNALQSKTKKN